MEDERIPDLRIDVYLSPAGFEARLKWGNQQWVKVRDWPDSRDPSEARFEISSEFMGLLDEMRK